MKLLLDLWRAMLLSRPVPALAQYLNELLPLQLRLLRGISAEQYLEMLEFCLASARPVPTEDRRRDYDRLFEGFDSRDESIQALLARERILKHYFEGRSSSSTASSKR